MKTKLVTVLCLAIGLSLLPSSAQRLAKAEEGMTIRFASLAPAGSTWYKVLKAWDNSLQKGTNGAVKLRFYSGGSQGDERDFVRKTRVGQMDGAGVTTTGLGMIVRPVLVLSVPGVVKDYDQLGRVREKMEARFEKMFWEAGYKHLAWGDAGKNRIFSTREIKKPEDLKAGRPWGWKDDPIYTEFLKTVGANPVALGIPEVYPALQTGMADSAPASALAAIALQWYTKLGFMMKQNLNIIIGGSVMRKDKFEALTKEQQAVLTDTAKRAAKALDTLVRNDDEKSYKTLVSRGIKEVDISANQAAWDEAAKKTREALIGRVYSKDLLDAVEAAAKGG